MQHINFGPALLMVAFLVLTAVLGCDDTETSSLRSPAAEIIEPSYLDAQGNPIYNIRIPIESKSMALTTDLIKGAVFMITDSNNVVTYVSPKANSNDGRVVTFSLKIGLASIISLSKLLYEDEESEFLPPVKCMANEKEINCVINQAIESLPRRPSSDPGNVTVSVKIGTDASGSGSSGNETATPTNNLETMDFKLCYLNTGVLSGTPICETPDEGKYFLGKDINPYVGGKDQYGFTGEVSLTGEQSRKLISSAFIVLNRMEASANPEVVVDLKVFDADNVSHQENLSLTIPTGPPGSVRISILDGIKKFIVKYPNGGKLSVLLRGSYFYGAMKREVFSGAKLELDTSKRPFAHDPKAIAPLELVGLITNLSYSATTFVTTAKLTQINTQYADPNKYSFNSSQLLNTATVTFPYGVSLPDFFRNTANLYVRLHGDSANGQLNSNINFNAVRISVDHWGEKLTDANGKSYISGNGFGCKNSNVNGEDIILKMTHLQRVMTQFMVSCPSESLSPIAADNMPYNSCLAKTLRGSKIIYGNYLRYADLAMENGNINQTLCAKVWD